MEMHTEKGDEKLRISYRLFGFSFWQAWWMLAMCTDILLPARSEAGTLFNPFFCITVLTTLGYLAAVLVSRSRKRPFTGDDRCYLAAGALASLGSFGLSCFTFVPYTGNLSAVFLGCAAVFSAGNALLLIMWGELWSTLATGRVGRYLYASYAFAFVLFFIVSALPPWGAAVTVCAFPVISALVLRASQGESKRSPSQIDFEHERLSPLKIAVAVFALGAVHGFVQRYLNVSGTVPDTTISASLLVAGCFLVALVIYLVASQPPAEPFTLYKPIVPAFTFGLILLAILPERFAFVGNGLMLLAVYSLDMLIMLVSTDIAFRTRRPVALCFGLVLFGERLGTTFASCAVYVLSLSGVLTAETSGTSFLLCTMIVITVGSFVFSSSDLSKLYLPRPTERSNESLADTCSQIAKACELTPREAEVLALLATGRSGPYIAKELCIAESTVKHHISSIYRKVGVYDRQSLVDVVLQGVVGKGALPH